MANISIGKILSGWNQQQLSNLGAILEISGDNPSFTEIADRIKWLYHSQTRAKIKSSVKNTFGKLQSLLDKKKRVEMDVSAQYELPNYTDLIFELADNLKLQEEDSTLADCEEFISHEIIIEALRKMSPSERRTFFNQTVNLSGVMDKTNVGQGALSGPMTTIAALGAAQASGMSIYLASSTALGFLTHAAGITLPFAAYTGLSSTIAFLIGPAGWLAAGSWAFWRATGPEWKRLVPALMYIIATNSQRKLKAG